MNSAPSDLAYRRLKSPANVELDKIESHNGACLRSSYLCSSYLCSYIPIICFFSPHPKSPIPNPQSPLIFLQKVSTPPAEDGGSGEEDECTGKEKGNRVEETGNAGFRGIQQSAAGIEEEDGERLESNKYIKQ